MGGMVGILVGPSDGPSVGPSDGLSVGALDGDSELTTQEPQVEVGVDTRVPVTLLYVPVIPEIVTKVPVTTPLELAQLFVEVVANPSQLPADPLADVSNDNVARGLPDPVQPEDEHSKQPAPQ